MPPFCHANTKIQISPTSFQIKEKKKREVNQLHQDKSPSRAHALPYEECRPVSELRFAASSPCLVQPDGQDIVQHPGCKELLIRGRYHVPDVPENSVANNQIFGIIVRMRVTKLTTQIQQQVRALFC